ncbi:Uncharacterized conserved protein [Tistlia consotensis]|uniref:Uncharacterized conserved protein n=1 Tax=Tistlia consotensis USBA 355 TaxID=560819 RepID=A0A1Y6CEE3_9PROT|nr:YciI family protein [Tistlia consotensis]SMF48218.1 Uncharacterized conserved protein [Tistlia consotensis USBA 355]SNR81613.1 Uncharacterized conserved protein [Tistlia consotensis]
MRVVVLVKASRGSEAGELPSEELLTAMMAYNEELVEAGIMQAGEGLKPSATGVRVGFDGDRRSVRKGPFTESNDLVAGFWLWKVSSMDEAVEWLKRCPNPHDEPTEVEIRPLFEIEDFGDNATPEVREQEARLRAQTQG